METWEMIKELTENPNKKFISIERNLKIIANVFSGRLTFRDEDGSIMDELYIDRTWEEVKESISFMEAVEALNSDKTIYVIHSGGYKETFSPKGNKTDWGYAMQQQQGYAIDTGLILYGKWYIE